MKLKKGIKKVEFSYNKNEGKQLKDLYRYVNKWNGNGKNLILITNIQKN